MTTAVLTLPVFTPSPVGCDERVESKTLCHRHLAQPKGPFTASQVKLQKVTEEAGCIKTALLAVWTSVRTHLSDQDESRQRPSHWSSHYALLTKRLPVQAYPS